MRKKILRNGLTVIHQKTMDKSIAVCALVKAGSNFESDRNRGVSHFIEHMVFEGTRKRSSLDITRAVEGLGGEINAYTTNERTCFTIKSLKRNIGSAMEILADIIINPRFAEDKIEKERGVILSEIALRKDQLSIFQWELFFRAVFNGYAAMHPVIGYRETIQKMKRKDIWDYYSSLYVPNNIIITVVGDIDDPFSLIEKHFGVMDKGKDAPDPPFYAPVNRTRRTVSEKRKTNQIYLILGYPAPHFGHEDSNTVDILRAILGKGMSGRLFDEIRNKRGLGYDIGVHYESSRTFGFFSCYVSADPKRIGQCERIIKDELNKASHITEKELVEAKNFLEGEFIFDKESNEKLADAISVWEYCGILKEFDSEIKRIQGISKRKVEEAARRYLTKDFSKALVHN